MDDEELEQRGGCRQAVVGPFGHKKKKTVSCILTEKKGKTKSSDLVWEKEKQGLDLPISLWGVQGSRQSVKRKKDKYAKEKQPKEMSPT